MHTQWKFALPTCTISSLVWITINGRCQVKHYEIFITKKSEINITSNHSKFSSLLSLSDYGESSKGIDKSPWVETLLFFARSSIQKYPRPYQCVQYYLAATFLFSQPLQTLSSPAYPLFLFASSHHVKTFFHFGKHFSLRHFLNSLNSSHIFSSKHC